jgi:hypothetical protein
MLRGLWIDDLPLLALSPGYLDELRDLGLHAAAVMVETSKARWDPYWSVEDARRMAVGLVDRDIEPIITVWLAPSRRYIDQMIAYLEMVVVAGYAAVEVDLEHLWRIRHLEGFDELTDAAVYALHRLLRIRDRLDVRLEVTTHPWHGESSPHALVTPHVDRLVLQAYSIREWPDGTTVDWYGPKGPGQMQQFAYEDALHVPCIVRGDVDLALGLPAWSQTWPGHAPADAMMTAYQAALDLGVVEARYWSSKFVLGARSNGYSNTFLRGIR